MNIPGNLKYTKNHEWVCIEDGSALFGITDHAQKALGDIAIVELPNVGRHLVPGESFAVVNQVHVEAPMEGLVTEINDDLCTCPGEVNTDPYGSGWLVRLRLVDADSTAHLLDAAAYEAFLAE